jgi:hypothetical protein
MVYIAMDSFNSLCGRIEKGKILVLIGSSLYYNDNYACKVNSINGVKCRKIEVN